MCLLAAPLTVGLDWPVSDFIAITYGPSHLSSLVEVKGYT